VIAAYIRDYRRHCSDELTWFAGQPSLKDAVWGAAMALRPDGKRLDHQRRIPASVLRTAAATLLHRAESIGASQSFAELFELVRAAVSGIRGFGELAIYDTALRIGAYLRLEPELIYLHAGTRTGARSLGILATQLAVPMQALPAVFSRLSPREIEDCLCIFKREIAGLQRTAPTSHAGRRS